MSVCVSAAMGSYDWSGRNPDSLEVWTDLASLDSAACVSSDGINVTVTQFGACLKSVQSDIASIECVELKAEITANVELAKSLLSETSRLQSAVEQKYERVKDYLSIGKAGYGYENLFGDLRQFKGLFRAAVKEIRERRELEALHRLKLEAISNLQKQQLERSGQLETMLAGFVEGAGGGEANGGKCLFKADNLIDNAIIGISSGKIFCDDEAM